MRFKPAREKAARRAPRIRHRWNLRGHVVDEEAEDAGLRGDVEKLRQHCHPEVRMRPDGMRDVWRGIVKMVVVLHLDVGHRREEKNDRENDHDHADERVRNPEPFAAGAKACRIF